MAITDAAHVPAPGARDLTFEELNVHGPLFQYWVLLKASWGAGAGLAGVLGTVWGQGAWVGAAVASRAHGRLA